MAGVSRSWSILILFCALALVSCTAPQDEIAADSGAPMVLVPAGEFQIAERDYVSMEYIVRSAYLDDFYLDVYEVTNQRYAECVGAGVCAEPVNTTYYADTAYLDHPVVYVTWEMAGAYCEWRGARLPVKDEWEKAASDELAAVEYYWGDVSPICQVGARLGAEIEPDDRFDVGTQPVGSQLPNAFGLHDMTGNVWEWVQDRYPGDEYQTSPEVVSFLRMTRWSGYGPLFGRFVCGFRCARTP
jgi:formylglycine-generating enzyme required for sulfatase activity